MKKILTLFTLCIFTLNFSVAAHLTPSIQVNARCSGQNEVPTVDSDGLGLAVVTLASDMRSLDFIFQASGLSGDITGIHIHEASTGENGPVVLNLTPFLVGNSIETNLRETGSFSIAKMISGEYYLNVHTDLNPDGEIRGQFRVEKDELFGGVISGDNEIPVISSLGEGFVSAKLLYSGTSLSLNASFEGITELVTGIHLHVGASDSTGPVVVDLAAGLLDNNLSIIVDASSFAQELRNGNIYLNIHTATNPAGEIRAQLLPYSGLEFDCVLNGSQEVPEVNTNAEGLVNFNYDYNNNQIQFEGFVSATNTDIIGAHLHTAPAGETGGVIVDLSEQIMNGAFSGTINNPSSALINAMLSGGIYLNVHTSEFPDGEIRGQIQRTLREGYFAKINGNSQVPSNESTASGVAMLSIDRDQSHGHYMVVVDGISSEFQASHFHDGGSGENGDVLFDITDNFIDGRGAFGYWADMGEAAVKIRTTGLYANFHTIAFPDGEVRGDYQRGSASQQNTSSEVKSQIFISSNTTGQIGVLLYDYNDDNSIFTFPANGADADGVYYDLNSDKLFQLNRSSNSIDIYENTLDAILDGTYPSSELSSTSDFSNGREITVSGNTLVAAQDANAGNMEMNRLISYDISGDTIQLTKITDTDINLWGIQLIGNDLWAIVDNSDGLVWFQDFISSTEDMVSPTEIISIENMIRTHGLHYNQEDDIMFLTDVAEAGSAEDGALVIVRNFSAAIADGMIGADEQTRIEGPMSTLGNPVDIDYDFNTESILIAERANGGGKILSFNLTDQNGDVAPNTSIDFPGASAIFFNSSRQRGQFIPYDPQFDGRLLFTGRLSGNNEVPAVTTDATGVMGILLSEDMTTAYFNLSVNGLSGPITGVHLHEAPAGSNGGVVLNLSENTLNTQLSMEMAMTEELLAKLFEGNIYVNVHTEMNPDGELRAQLILEKDLSFVNWITGAQEVPSVDTEAMGLISANLTQVMNELEINAFFRGLSSHIIGAHLHIGEEGTNGGVVADLSDFVSGQMINARIDANAFASDLRAGNIYLNIHTENNPDGEIRAQLNEWGGISIDGWISGQQSVPSISTAGLGLMAANVDPVTNTMTLWAISDNLSSDFNAAHLHLGSIGENGGVWIDLTDGINGQDIIFEAMDFDDSALLDLLKGNVYLNLHTTNFPDGEIRSQAIPLTRDSYNYRICAEQENHTVLDAENANGGGILSLDRKGQNLHLMAVASRLTGAVTGVHLHQGIVNTNGGVIFDMTDSENNGGVFLYGTSDNFLENVAMPIQMESVYINFHTVANPDGEIRGQIVKESICDIVSSVNDQIDFAEASIFPNPFNNAIQIEYNNSSVTDRIEIISSTGQLVYRGTVNFDQSIDLDYLEPGTYFLLIHNENMSIREKIIKI